MRARFRHCGIRLGLVSIWPSARLRHGADRRERLPPQPTENHRQCVRLRLLLPAKSAGGTERLRELAVTASPRSRASGALRPMGSPGASTTRARRPGEAHWRNAGDLRRRRTEVVNYRAALRDRRSGSRSRQNSSRPPRALRARPQRLGRRRRLHGRQRRCEATCRARQGPNRRRLQRMKRAIGAEGGSRERAPAPLGSRPSRPRGRPRRLAGVSLRSPACRVARRR